MAVDSDIASKPNLSVKLTALYPRFEYAKLHDIRQELMPNIWILFCIIYLRYKISIIGYFS